MQRLVDSNVLLALVLEAHPHHEAARAWVERLASGDRLMLCRATQTSFLRLLTTEAILKAETRTNGEALEVLESLMASSQFGFTADEPPSLWDRWRQLAVLGVAAPKRWMDAYLAAWAIEAGMHLVTLDRGFTQFEKSGLNLVLLGRTSVVP
jgi:uncharacterized protein